MSAPTFNKFKSTTIYGNFNNVDFTDSSGGVITPAIAHFQSDVTSSGIIYGKKLFYDNVDISSTFVSNLTLSSTLSNYVMSGGSASFNMLNLNQPAIIQFLDNSGNAKALIYPSAISNVFRFSVYSGNGFEWENAGTTLMQLNTSGHLTLSGATFSGNVSGLTATTSDNSNKFATTAFVKNQNYITSNPDLSPYALLSALSNYALSSTLNNYALSSTLNNYALSSSLSNYALSSTLNNYALSSTLNDYALSSSLSNYALSSTLNDYALSSTLKNYALLSGITTFTGTVNLNNGFATPTGKDVFIGCNTAFPTTNSGFKTGLGFYWNQTGGVGEVNLLCYGQGGTGGLSIWNSNVSNVPNKLVEFFPSGSVFTTTVNGITPATADNSTKFATTEWVKLQNYLTSLSASGTVNITQPSSTSSAVLQFLTNTGLARANIYSSFVDSRFCFDVIPFFNEYGFEWRVDGEPIMRLGLGGTLITEGSISTPYTKIGSQEIISQASITLSFPLLSSYLIQKTQPVSVYLPVITANWEMGVEVLFIKNSGTCNIYAANNNVIIDSLLFQSTSINISQYRRLISTKLSSGIFGWMVVGSGN